MSSQGPYRRHSPQFKIQICSDIRSDKLTRREVLKVHNLSTNLLRIWLTQFDRGELDAEEAVASTVAEYEGHNAALERKVSQLRMELGLLKKDRHGFDSQQQRVLIEHQRPKPATAPLSDHELAQLIEDLH